MTYIYLEESTNCSLKRAISVLPASLYYHLSILYHCAQGVCVACGSILLNKYLARSKDNRIILRLVNFQSLEPQSRVIRFTAMKKKSQALCGMCDGSSLNFFASPQHVRIEAYTLRLIPSIQEPHTQLLIGIRAVSIILISVRDFLVYLKFYFSQK